MTSIAFGPFCLDTVRGELMYCGQGVDITPKAYAVLEYLLKHPGQLVTTEQLLLAVWPKVRVVRGVLKVCIRELRRALGDSIDQPRFIQTVHRRGYRFISAVARGEAPNDPQTAAARSGFLYLDKSSDAETPHPWFVGYRSERAQLRTCLESAVRGQGQFVFIAGEVGIGKTTLIRRFLADLPSQRFTRSATGQCFAVGREGLGYLPVLEALSWLCRQSDGQHVLNLLRARAPTWLDQMPAFYAGSEAGLQAHEANDTSFDRMLKELADFIDACTAEQPLVLVFEDLHANGQTMAEIINYLARREKSAPFMLIGSYCNSPSLRNNHPLKLVLSDLKGREAGLHLSLGGLDEAAVAEFMARRLSTAADPLNSEISRRLFEESEGNPLFMIQLMDHWTKCGVLGSLAEETPHIIARPSDPQISIPDYVHELVDAWFELLAPDEQRILEAASVNGSTFSALVLARALGEDVEAIEECCERLARQQQFLKSTPQQRWPERRSASRYAFKHRLYQQVLYRRLPIARRLRLYAGETRARPPQN